MVKGDDEWREGILVRLVSSPALSGAENQGRQFM